MVAYFKGWNREQSQTSALLYCLPWRIHMSVADRANNIPIIFEAYERNRKMWCDSAAHAQPCTFMKSECLI